MKSMKIVLNSLVIVALVASVGSAASSYTYNVDNTNFTATDGWRSTWVHQPTDKAWAITSGSDCDVNDAYGLPGDPEGMSGAVLSDLTNGDVASIWGNSQSLVGGDAILKMQIADPLAEMPSTEGGYAGLKNSYTVQYHVIWAKEAGSTWNQKQWYSLDEGASWGSGQVRVEIPSDFQWNLPHSDWSYRTEEGAVDNDRWFYRLRLSKTYENTDGNVPINFWIHSNDGGQRWVGVDDVTFVVSDLMPEPATLVMLGLGGLAALLRRRR